MAPAHQLCIVEGWFVVGDRYSPQKGACFLPLHTTSAQHWHEDYYAAKLSKNSLAVQAQFVFGTIFNVSKGGGKQEAKFWGFSSPTTLTLKTNLKVLVFWILNGDDDDQQNTVSRLQKRISAVPAGGQLKQQDLLQKPPVQKPLEISSG